MARSVMNGAPQSLALRIAAGVSVLAVAVAAVWFLGFDLSWSVASVLAMVPVAALLATAGLEEDAPWDPPWREAPRGIRLTVAAIERSLDACDRLTGPSALRHVRALLHDERNDRLARTTVARRVRALLVAELSHRGLDVAKRPDDDAILALISANALTILRPSDDHPVTVAAIAESLDVIERLSAQPKGAL
jgi:hypothetical protein